MTFIVWNDYLVTGIDLIDRQHRSLVDLVNRAAPLLTQTGVELLPVIPPLLAALTDYAATHFRDEEALMAARGIDARSLTHHRASHAAFARKVEVMVGDMTVPGGTTGDQLLSFLASWLLLHILGEDQAMARQLRALQAGAPPTQAYDDARGWEIAPAPEALHDALVDAYTALTRQNRTLMTTNRDLDASQAEVRRQNENLEALVRERTADLETLAGDLRRSRDAAEAGSRAKTRFLGTVSHEFRTPMNAIMGYSHLLRGAGLPPAQEDLAGKIVNASEDLLDRVNRVVDYARVDDGDALALVDGSFAVRALLAQASESAFAAARAKGLTTLIDVDPALPPGLRGDPRCIASILRQFVANAAKFTSSGSLRLEARLVEGDSQQRFVVRFAVTDSGIGIPPEAQGQLFSPFAQLDDGPGRKHEGIGLGLALARQLARGMGGDVGVTSEPGKGSTFWLQLALGQGEGFGGDLDRLTGVAKPLPPAEMPASAPGQALPDDIGITLREIERLLGAFDTRAASVLQEAASRVRPFLGQRADELARRIVDFEFEQALAIVRVFTEVQPARTRETI